MAQNQDELSVCPVVVRMFTTLGVENDDNGT